MMTLKQSFFAAILCCIATFASAQTWTKAADFPGAARENAITFVIGNNAYMGLGKAKGGITQNDFWKYDATKNVWAKITNFPAAWRTGTVTFVIKGKAYVGLGQDDNTFINYNDLYEYDPSTDKWTKKASFPEPGRRNCTYFSFDNIKTGVGLALMGKDEQGFTTSNNYEYEPSKNTWTKRTDIANPDVDFSYPFSSSKSVLYNGKGYVFGGTNGSTVIKDLYEYNPITSKWKKVTTDDSKMPNASSSAFVLDNVFYFCYGNKAEILEYDLATDYFTAIADPFKVGDALYFANSFVIGNSAYVTGGEPGFSSTLSTYPKTLWKLSVKVAVEEIANDNEDLAIFPSIAKDNIIINTKQVISDKASISLFSANGQLLQSQKVSDTTTSLSVADLANGFYIVQYQTAEKTLTKRVIVQH